MELSAHVQVDIAGRITEDRMMLNEFDVMAQVFGDEPDSIIRSR